MACSQLTPISEKHIITFTDLAYIQGDGVQLNCSYVAVIYADESLHGVWFYPNDMQPDGTFVLNKTSE
jgi:hypothetical protein